ncbi:MAG: hypothetical protein HFG93_04865 [Dorea sp.]|nr:hypothetical protein [Dorea sp.]
MARKSNKTAHVLNLLAGHDTQNTTDEAASSNEAASVKDKASSTADTAGSKAAASSESTEDAPSASEPARSTSSPAPAKSSTGKEHGTAQNISVIDTTGTDPLAELLNKKLSDEFGEADVQNPGDETDSVSDSPVDTTSSKEADPAGQTEPAHADTAKSAVDDNTSSTAPASALSAEEASLETDTPVSDEAVFDADTLVSDEVSSGADASAPDEVSSGADISAPQETTSGADASAPQELSAKADTSSSANTTADTVDSSTEASEDPFAFPQTRSDTPSESITVPGPGPVTDTVSVPPESVPGPGHTAPKQAPVKETVPEPEPDFVYLNIMEEIVKDKIIYFMRQFDVCTCDRCKADTIALAMNGLQPKYIVTTPAAVDPLLSYYTNRLISDVTVEATKACMTIKDNPRH